MSKQEIYDAIVVGSGAAGSWAAKTLTEGGLRVLLLEAGRQVDPVADFAIEPLDSSQVRVRMASFLRGQHIQSRCSSFSYLTRRFFVDDRQNPYATARGKPFYWFRGRQLGGRLHTWSRTALRMSDAEFHAHRKDGLGLDWPIGYEELEPSYTRVERFLGVHGTGENLACLPDGSFIKPAPMSRAEREGALTLRKEIAGIHPIPARLVKHNPARIPTPILAAAKTGRLTVRTDAVVRNIETDSSSGRATGVVFVDAATKSTQRAKSRVVLLCASTIESVRILLNSAGPAHRHGLGNSSGTLGRYLMDHVMVPFAGPLTDEQKHMASTGRRIQRDPFDFGVAGLYVPRFETDGLRRGAISRGYGIQCGINEAFPGWWFLAFGEMISSPHNRIALHSSRTDAWGIPIASVVCEHSDHEKAMVEDMKTTMRAMANALDLVVRPPAEMLLGKSLLAKLMRQRGFTPYGAAIPGASIHEAGGAPMGSDPQHSVLNHFNQCWDAKNVLVTDASCFPSAGYQNTTLTIMAITDRACRSVVEQLQRQDL